MFRRGDSRDLETVLGELVDRIDKLEEAATRRILPYGYFWKVDDSGQLVVVRDSDSATAVVL